MGGATYTTIGYYPRGRRGVYVQRRGFGRCVRSCDGDCGEVLMAWCWRFERWVCFCYGWLDARTAAG